MGSRVSQIRGAIGGGGQTVRVAQGIVRINVAPLDADARLIKGRFQDISNSGRQIGKGVREGSRDAQAGLKELTSAAQSAAGQLARLFALPTLAGIGQNVKQIDFTIRALAGSEEKANQQLAQMKSLADRTGQSFLSIQKAALGILPSINRANVDLEQTLLLTQRLAILDPAQGVEGAAFAIRELLSGQTTSLAGRFEFAKTDLNQILSQAGGDQQKIIDGLDQLIAKMGITEQTIMDAGDAGIYAFSNLKDELILTTATAFEPFFNNALIPIVEGFGDLTVAAREANPELLNIAGTLAGILATMTALQAVGLGGKWTTGLAVAGGALYAGTEIGTAAARFAAENGVINNPALENVSQDQAKEVIGDTFKQAVVVAVDSLITFYGVLKVGIGNFENMAERAVLTGQLLGEGAELGYIILKTGFENFVTVLENAGDMVGAALELMALDFVDAFAEAIAALGQILIDLPLGGKFDRKGQDIIDSATGGQGGRDTRRSELNQRAGADLNEGTVAIGDAIAGIAERIGETIDAINSTSIAISPEEAKAIFDEVQNLRQQIIPALAETFGLLKEETDSWAERTKKNFDGRAAAAAPVSDFTAEMLEAFSKFQKELADLEKQAAADRKKVVEDALKQRREAENKLGKDIEKVQTDASKRENELNREYYRTAEQDELEHKERLADINRNANRDAQNAAARIDAVGLRAALERQTEQVDEENRSHEKQRAEQDRRYGEEMAALQQGSAEKIAALRASYAEELVAIETQRQEKLNQINAELREETAARNLAFAELHNQMAAESGNHNQRMLNIQQQGTAALEAQYRAWIEGMGGYAPQPTQQQYTQATNVVSSAGNQAMKTFKSKLPSFDSGIGFIPHDMTANLHLGEGVMNENTAALMRSMTGSPNPSQSQMQNVISGGGKPSLSIGNINFNGDIGNNSRAELDAHFREVALDAFENVIDEWMK